MAEPPLPGNPAGLVADPRYRNVLLTLNHLRPGQVAESVAIHLRVEEGGGEAWYTPDYLPTLGSLQSGTLVLSSPCFPRYAPLTLTIEGADLCFTVRNRQTLGVCLVDGLDELLRIRCTNFIRAAQRLRLRAQVSKVELPDESTRSFQRLRLRSENLASGQSIVIDTDVVRGKLGILACAAVDPDGTSVDDRVSLRRDANGELRWRLHAARMELDFRDGALHGLRLFGAAGQLARVHFLNLSAAFTETLP
jgi:hypothetical protein